MSTTTAGELSPASVNDSPHNRKRRSSLRNMIEETRRATVQNPSRPFTPRDNNRKMFMENEYSNRPQSAFSINSSHFDAKVSPLYNKPMSARSSRLLAMIDNARQMDQQYNQSPDMLDNRSEIHGDIHEHDDDEVLYPTMNQNHRSPTKTSNEHRESSDDAWDQISSYLNVLTTMNQQWNTSSPHVITNLIESADAIYQLLDSWIQEQSNPQSNNSALEDNYVSTNISLYETRRRLILQSVSKLMDHSQVQLIFKLCAIILKLKPDGLFLLSTSKLLFKLSKSESNDSLFQSEQVLTLLVDLLYLHVRKSILLSNEILIYTIATVKNASSSSSKNQQALLSCDILTLLSLLLNDLTCQLEDHHEASSPSPTTNTSPNTCANHSRGMNVDKQGQLLVQVTGTLRNIACSTNVFKSISKTDIIPNLFTLLQLMKKHTEFVLNTSRFLSKVSLDPSCISKMISCGTEAVHSMMKLLSRYKNHVPIVIRLCFILGNLSFCHEETRYTISSQKYVTVLTSLVNVYGKMFVMLNMNEDIEPIMIEMKMPPTSTAPSLTETSDLLLKLIRVVANAALVQAEIISQQQAIVILVDILDLLNIDRNEELMLNIIRCLTNLTFHSSVHSSTSLLVAHQKRIAAAISPLLTKDEPDIIYEAVRCFGNISSHDAVKDWMMDHMIDEMMILLLKHDDTVIVQSSCGVLLNLTSQSVYIDRMRHKLIEHDIANLLMGIVEEAPDWNTISILLQLVHNIIAHDNDNDNRDQPKQQQQLFSDRHLQELRMTLPELLNMQLQQQQQQQQKEEKDHETSDGESGDDGEENHETTQLFATIISNLLDLIS